MSRIKNDRIEVLKLKNAVTPQIIAVVKKGGINNFSSHCPYLSIECPSHGCTSYCRCDNQCGCHRDWGG
jgi:hypothetical protein